MLQGHITLNGMALTVSCGSYCFGVNLKARSSPQTSQGTTRKAWSQTVCVLPRGNMLPQQGARIHKLNRAIHGKAHQAFFMGG